MLKTQLGPQSRKNFKTLIQILEFCKTPKQVKDIREKLNYINRSKFRTCYIRPLLDNGFLEMTIPEKPNSRIQRYRLTSKSIELLKKCD